MRSLRRALSAAATHAHHNPPVPCRPSIPSLSTTATATTSRRLFSQEPRHQPTLQKEQQPQQQAEQQQQKQHPPQTPSYYAFFPRTLPDGPPPRGPFRIQARALRSEFLSLQAKHHPDKQQQQQQHQDQLQDQQQQDQPQAQQQQPDPQLLSATINQAYRTLLDPLLRAEYLLSQHGFSTNDETASLDGRDGVDEASLLALVMDAHEQIEEACAAEDLEPLQVENEERIAESERILETAFAEGDWAGAKREAVRLKYWVNIRGAVRDWEGGRESR
ncbi:hypothetical protein E4U21_003526 [Claviceps maximensis]|nr:hypothetical protein E4U21_003526 [Claviceps maximensis]